VSTKPAPEIYHSRFDCDLCGREDYCVKAYGAGPHLVGVVICSACVEHMHRLYDDLEREFPSYELRRNEAQA
jgi:transcription elongation factor Elf1